MGLEALQAEPEERGVSSSSSSPSSSFLPVVIGLQPLALVDQVARVDWSLLNSIPGERGGSQRVNTNQTLNRTFLRFFSFLVDLFYEDFLFLILLKVSE